MRILLLLLAGCGVTDPPDDPGGRTLPGCAPEAWHAPPACGSGPVERGALLSPAEPGFPELAAKAHRIDRLFHALFAAPTGVNAEAVVPLEDPAGRAAIEAFVAGDGWDLEASASRPLGEVVGTWTKVAGAYAGVGVAADAFRYGVLRDEGAPCEEVERARTHLLAALEGLHRAVAITGAPGVIARGYARTDADSYGSQVETVPLFDDDGAPLPAEKDNGTWREDGSGLYPDYVWEDSCSRDMLVGWAFGFGAAWEVVRLDPTIPDDVRDTVRADAAALARGLMEVRASGFDLEITDADGRLTYHGVLHEESIDRFYVPGARNGQNALMALGIVAALALAAEDPEIDAWLVDHLVGERDLPELARETAHLIDFGTGSNFSGYNMGFAGGLMAWRWLCDADARAAVAEAVDVGMYAIPGRARQPEEQGQTLYDWSALLARRGGGAWWPAERPDDRVVLTMGLTTLQEFPDAPTWDFAVQNCDEAEIASLDCVAVDGTLLPLAAGSGRNDVLVADVPVPMRLRPPSNYHWRSNPYAVNGGGEGAVLLPGVDFRLTWWLGRWVTREPRDP